MNSLPHAIQALTKIYPEHIWISVNFDSLDKCLIQTKIELMSIAAVKKHLSDLGLVVKSIFPSEEAQLISVINLVNGFALSIDGIKIAFILSHDLDLLGFEVPREWVDLSNWAADYYVPIQVDLEHHYIHLWGFVSHQHLIQTATLDRNLQSYEVENVDLINDLDLLWIAGELVASGGLAPERGKISSLTSLSNSEAQVLIDRLQQHKSIFSPRLVLPFEQWGAIINSPEHLAMYINPALAITKIGDWFQSQVDVVKTATNTIVDRGWVAIDEFCKQPETLSGYFAASQKTKFGVRGIALNNDREIHRAVKNLYTNQQSTNKVNLPDDLDLPSGLLIHLIQSTTDETLRWQAAEYLWTIAPDDRHNYQRKIKDLGLVMQGHKLGLMVAVIPLLEQRYAILNRVYSLGNEDYLPPNVKLSLSSEANEQLYQVESRELVQDIFIQLYFTASVGDRFNIGVAIDNVSITEAFAI